MARAATIWTVQDNHGSVITAFTVKHELATWLDRRYGPAEFRNAATCPVLILRVPDGHYYPDATPTAINPSTLKDAT